jgi:hypothetical protein
MLEGSLKERLKGGLYIEELERISENLEPNEKPGYKKTLKEVMTTINGFGKAAIENGDDKIYKLTEEILKKYNK